MKTNHEEQIMLYIIGLFGALILGIAARWSAISLGVDNFTANAIGGCTVILGIILFLMIRIVLKESIYWLLNKMYPSRFEKIEKSEESYTTLPQTAIDSSVMPSPILTPTNETISIQSRIYFDMGLINSIHKECNDEQFEDIAEIELYAHLNLLPATTTLKIKSGEKTRVCYLVHKLHKYLKGNDRTEWLTAILKKLDIDEGYYRSKYKEPVSEIPSRKSEQFAKVINDIFK